MCICVCIRLMSCQTLPCAPCSLISSLGVWCAFFVVECHWGQLIARATRDRTAGKVQCYFQHDLIARKIPIGVILGRARVLHYRLLLGIDDYFAHF